MPTKLDYKVRTWFQNGDFYSRRDNKKVSCLVLSLKHSTITQNVIMENAALSSTHNCRVHGFLCIFLLIEMPTRHCKRKYDILGLQTHARVHLLMHSYNRSCPLDSD